MIPAAAKNGFTAHVQVVQHTKRFNDKQFNLYFAEIIMPAKPPFKNPAVKTVFTNYPKKLQDKLLFLRNLVYKIAAKTEGIGELEETLKWGSPGYLTNQSKSGTTLRIDRIGSQAGKYGMFVHCQTSLVGSFKKIYGDAFDYDGNRGIILDERDDIPVKEISHFIYLALTYHLGKKQKNVKSPWK